MNHLPELAAAAQCALPDSETSPGALWLLEVVVVGATLEGDDFDAVLDGAWRCIPESEDEVEAVFIDLAAVGEPISEDAAADALSMHVSLFSMAVRLIQKSRAAL